MKIYMCSICGYIYDEAAGIPKEGIPPGTKWEDVPKDWSCPLCGASKEDFVEKQITNQPAAQKLHIDKEESEELRELSFLELSTLCSNLSKGCEKQYRTEEAGVFHQLAQYYQSKDVAGDKNQFEDLNALIQQDLSSGYTQANVIAADQADRGALRALTWGEKVTRMFRIYTTHCLIRRSLQIFQ